MSLYTEALSPIKRLIWVHRFGFRNLSGVGLLVGGCVGSSFLFLSMLHFPPKPNPAQPPLGLRRLGCRLAVGRRMPGNLPFCSKKGPAQGLPCLPSEEHLLIIFLAAAFLKQTSLFVLPSCNMSERIRVTMKNDCVPQIR